MFRYVYKYSSFILFIVCLFACHNTQKTSSLEIKRDAINELVFEIKQKIIPKYYNFESKRVVHINLAKIESNYDEEPLFEEYIYSKISQLCDAANPINLEPYPDSTYDVDAAITVLRETNGNLKILSTYSDSNTQKIFYANQNSYDISDFDLVDYNNFKQNYVGNIESEKQKCNSETFISVKVVYQGDSYKAEDKYYLRTDYGPWGATDYIIKHDTGSSGYYPINVKCKINDKIYCPNAEYIFYEGEISPGTSDFVASFQGGFWDGYDREEKILTSVYSKNFKINVRPNDNLKVDIICFYNGEKRSMKVKVYRVKKIFVEGTVFEQPEIIEVF